MRKLLNTLTCPELVVGPSLHGGGGSEGLRHGALAWVRRVRVGVGVGVGVWVGPFGLALGVVDEHEAVLLVDAQRVGPAVGVVRAAVHRPRGSGPTRRTWTGFSD